VVLAIAFVIGTGSGVTAVLASDNDQSEAHQDFLVLCAECHGEDARGNGPMAKNLTKTPPDLTQISKRAGGTFDEQAVFDWIIGLNMPASHGSREMPIWGDWLMDETLEDSTTLETANAAAKEVEARVMALVKFLESVQNKD
jgi:mono/diheme cytochrome c family protein